MLHYAEYASPVGMLILTSDEENLLAVDFKVNDLPFVSADTIIPEVLDRTRQWLDVYFRGEQPDPGILPLKSEGTEFQKLVWRILLEIPYGTSRTYGDIAKEVALLLGKKKMSAQAVGQAVGRNPIAIIIPCHRVLGAGGKLTGYSCGLQYKIALLEHEAIHYSEES